MKVGDLVRYRPHHTRLQHLVGVITVIRTIDGLNRSKAIWSDPSRNWIWDWVQELEVINESR